MIFAASMLEAAWYVSSSNLSVLLSTGSHPAQPKSANIASRYLRGSILISKASYPTGIGYLFSPLFLRNSTTVIQPFEISSLATMSTKSLVRLSPIAFVISWIVSLSCISSSFFLVAFLIRFSGLSSSNCITV